MDYDYTYKKGKSFFKFLSKNLFLKVNNRNTYSVALIRFLSGKDFEILLMNNFAVLYEFEFICFFSFAKYMSCVRACLKQTRDGRSSIVQQSG